MSAYAGARLVPFWLDRSDAPAPAPPLTGDATCDLAIVGGGFTGLWAAILAKQDDPGRDVVLVEGDTVAFGGSGRNGGFVDASLTHGLPNGLARFPDEIDELERLGLENLAGIEETMERFSIDAAYEKTGFLVAARGAARGGGAFRAHGAAAGAGDRRGVPRPGGGAARARLADVHRRNAGSAPATRSSIRRGWRGAWRARRPSWACGSTSTAG